MKAKKERRCPECTRYNVNCKEPNRSCPKYATECSKWSESPQKPLKCKPCNGKGFVAIGESVKGLQKCPFCNGTGEVNCKPMSFAEFSGGADEIIIVEED